MWGGGGHSRVYEETRLHWKLVRDNIHRVIVKLHLKEESGREGWQGANASPVCILGKNPNGGSQTGGLSKTIFERIGGRSLLGNRAFSGLIGCFSGPIRAFFGADRDQFLRTPQSRWKSRDCPERALFGPIGAFRAKPPFAKPRLDFPVSIRTKIYSSTNQSCTYRWANRQSPIASVQRSQSTLESYSAVPRGTNTKPTNANRAIRIADKRTQGL